MARKLDYTKNTRLGESTGYQPGYVDKDGRFHGPSVKDWLDPDDTVADYCFGYVDKEGVHHK